MRKTFIVFLAICFAISCFALMAADKAAPKDAIKFTAKNGTVAFSHATHVKAEKGKCDTCHPKLFPQSAKEPINFKAGMHKPAETGKTSCGFCHHEGGASFASKGNCTKCHQKEAKG